VGFSRLILPNALPEGVRRLVSEVAAMSTSRSVALFLVVVVDAALLCAGADAQAVPAPSIKVALQVVSKDDLEGIAWMAMTQEARAIWAREGVELIWDAADTAVTLRLPVSFDDRTLRKYDSKGPTALGMTLFTGRSRQILISVRRARSLASAASAVLEPDGTMGRDGVLGRLLGRVLAHEIGHALLLTKGHSAHGLMSGSIMWREVTPLHGDQLALSVRERDRLATLFSKTPEPERRSAGVR
jgi:hypothetical protein